MVVLIYDRVIVVVGKNDVKLRLEMRIKRGSCFDRFLVFEAFDVRSSVDVRRRDVFSTVKRAECLISSSLDPTVLSTLNPFLLIELCERTEISLCFL
jgi:hypothetical protein